METVTFTLIQKNVVEELVQIFPNLSEEQIKKTVRTHSSTNPYILQPTLIERCVDDLLMPLSSGGVIDVEQYYPDFTTSFTEPLQVGSSSSVGEIIILSADLPSETSRSSATGSLSSDVFSSEPSIPPQATGTLKETDPELPDILLRKKRKRCFSSPTRVMKETIPVKDLEGLRTPLHKVEENSNRDGIHDTPFGDTKPQRSPVLSAVVLNPCSESVELLGGKQDTLNRGGLNSLVRSKHQSGGHSFTRTSHDLLPSKENSIRTGITCCMRGNECGQAFNEANSRNEQTSDCTRLAISEMVALERNKERSNKTTDSTNGFAELAQLNTEPSNRSGLPKSPPSTITASRSLLVGAHHSRDNLNRHGFSPAKQGVGLNSLTEHVNKDGLIQRTNTQQNLAATPLKVQQKSYLPMIDLDGMGDSITIKSTCVEINYNRNSVTVRDRQRHTSNTQLSSTDGSQSSVNSPPRNVYLSPTRIYRANTSTSYTMPASRPHVSSMNNLSATTPNKQAVPTINNPSSSVVNNASVSVTNCPSYTTAHSLSVSTMKYLSSTTQNKPPVSIVNTSASVANSPNVLTTNYPSTATNYPSTATNYPSMSTNYPSTSTNYPSTSTNYPSTATNYPSTASNYPSTATNYQSTSTNYPSTSTNYPSTATNYLSSATNYPSTATNYPSSATSYPSSATNYPSTATNYPSLSTYYPSTVNSHHSRSNYLNATTRPTTSSSSVINHHTTLATSNLVKVPTTTRHPEPHASLYGSYARNLVNRTPTLPLKDSFEAKDEIQNSSERKDSGSPVFIVEKLRIPSPPRPQTPDAIWTAAINDIMMMFPDVDPEFLERCRSKYCLVDPKLTSIICNMMLENGYEKKKKKSPGPVTDSLCASSTVSSNKSSIIVDYYTAHESPSQKKVDKDPIYANQAIYLLKAEFIWFSVVDINKVMEKFAGCYAPSHRALNSIWREVVKTTSGTSEQKQQGIQRFSLLKYEGVIKSSGVEIRYKGQTLKGPRKMPEHPFDSLCKLLQEEVIFIRNKRKEEEEEADFKLAQELNEQIYEESGQLIECGCCFGEFPFDSLVQCYDGHLFCSSCLQQYAQESVFGQGKALLSCMTDGCDSSFPFSQLEKALAASVLDRYLDRMKEESLNLADLGDLVRCPHCEFAAIMDPLDKVFACQNDSCRRETCRFCKEDWTEHFGKKCSELEQQSETKLRLKYEEKMTQAKMRSCHRCKASFTKEDGCNKMTCRCGAKMCYICRKPNIDYNHFCKHPLDPGKKCNICTNCSLWSNPHEDEERAIAELQKEAAELRKAEGYEEDKLIGAPVQSHGPPEKKKKK